MLGTDGMTYCSAQSLELVVQTVSYTRSVNHCGGVGATMSRCYARDHASDPRPRWPQFDGAKVRFMHLLNTSGCQY